MPKDNEDKSNTIRDPNADKIEAKAERDKTVRALAEAICVEFGMQPERWQSFEIEARTHLCVHEFFNRAE